MVLRLIGKRMKVVGVSAHRTLIKICSKRHLWAVLVWGLSQQPGFSPASPKVMCQPLSFPLNLMASS